MNCKHLAPWHHYSEVWQYVDVLRFRYLHVHMSMHHTRLPHLHLNSCKMKPNPRSTEWIGGNSRVLPRSPNKNTNGTNLERKWHTDPRSGTQLKQDWNTCNRSASATRLEHPPSRVMERNWDTSGTEPRHSWYMHHKWRRHLRVSSYKMESPDP